MVTNKNLFSLDTIPKDLGSQFRIPYVFVYVQYNLFLLLHTDQSIFLLMPEQPFHMKMNLHLQCRLYISNLFFPLNIKTFQWLLLFPWILKISNDLQNIHSYDGYTKFVFFSLFLSHLLRDLYSKQCLHFISQSKIYPVSTEMIKTTPSKELKTYCFCHVPSTVTPTGYVNVCVIIIISVNGDQSTASFNHRLFYYINTIN